MGDRGARSFAGKPKSFKHKDPKFDPKTKFGKKKKRWEIEEGEIKALQESYGQIDSSAIKTFSDFPLSKKTKKGLREAEYIKPSEIQRESIGLALQENDILGAAKTGSGKTLAFLIPVLECLFRQKWSQLDGLGALIITPTRELAYQIFEVLRRVGKFHDFSAGLVIGGKLLKDESERINKTNIVICTPGRLLQHMDETAYFHADNLQILVLDEADRCLDLGFQHTMNAIIKNLPPKRQTLLFSATQTKSVKDLARLSLKDPMYVSVHEHAKHSTPAQLQQSYTVCELSQKMNFLWSFIKNHLKSKILVFLSCCKQVRFVHECFRKLKPGMTVLALHGAMQQLKRVAMYEHFCRKHHAVLFATDIAARGLDFPAVNWVIQLDCPEDANTYIHRAGRTARYEEDGEALLVLLPSEKPVMIQQLEEKKIPISEIKVNPSKLWSIQTKLQSLLASDVTLKEYAQRAFMSYIRSVYLMSNKKVFDVHKLDTDQFAWSLGLAIPPRIRFLQKEQKRLEEKKQVKERKAESQQEDEDDDDEAESEDEDDSSSDSDSDQTTEKFSATSDNKKSVSKVGSDAKKELYNFDIGDDELDDLLVVKKKHHVREEDGQLQANQPESSSSRRKKPQTKVAAVKKLLKKKIQLNSRVVFDEEGEAVKDDYRTLHVKDGPDTYEGGINIEEAKKILQEEDQFDKKLFRQKIREQHQQKRWSEREKRRKMQREQEEDDEAILDTEEGGVNLDDLPDPDKIYGPKADNSDSSSEESESDSEDDTPPKKRARSEKKESCSESDSSESKESDEEMEEEEEEEEEEKSELFDTGLSLLDDEALALKLLE